MAESSSSGVVQAAITSQIGEGMDVDDFGDTLSSTDHEIMQDSMFTQPIETSPVIITKKYRSIATFQGERTWAARHSTKSDSENSIDEIESAQIPKKKQIVLTGNEDVTAEEVFSMQPLGEENVNCSKYRVVEECSQIYRKGV